MDITQHTELKTFRKYKNEDPNALKSNLKNTRSVDSELKVVKKAN